MNNIFLCFYVVMILIVRSYVRTIIQHNNKIMFYEAVRYLMSASIGAAVILIKESAFCSGKSQIYRATSRADKYIIDHQG